MHLGNGQERKIPIFVITCDRLEFLKKSMQSYYNCIKTPFEIVICDQGSTFKPMMEFLNKLESEGIRVYRWKENPSYGEERNLRRDDRKINKDIRNYFKTHPESNYVVTDSDILLDNVNGDVLDVYAYFLEKFPRIFAIGPMLRIDDIPDYYPLKKKLISGKMGCHKRFHSFKKNTIQYKHRTIRYIFAPIHTTFAMYRKGTRWRGFSRRSIRILAPYSAKHLDWYVDPKNLSEDQKYYMKHASTNAHWSNWSKWKCYP